MCAVLQEISSTEIIFTFRKISASNFLFKKRKICGYTSIGTISRHALLERSGDANSLTLKLPKVVLEPLGVEFLGLIRRNEFRKVTHGRNELLERGISKLDTVKD